MSNALERIWYPAAPDPLWRRIALSPLALASLGYRLVVSGRNALYDARILRTHRIEGLRVVSVGNLTVGGAGKTPVVIALAQRALQRGRATAVLSRGYGRASREVIGFDSRALPSAEEVGDEPRLIALRCPGVRVWVGPDRVALARRARAEGAELALLDDGMQHRRLDRDVDLVVVDALVGLGNAGLLPRGPLREPASGMARASAIWLRVPEEGEAPSPGTQVPIIRALHRARALVSYPSGAHLPLEALEGRAVVALAGIARPHRFVATLERAGARVVERYFVADHAVFPEALLAAATTAAERGGAWLVTTEKDWMRLPPQRAFHVLTLGVEVLEGESHLDALLFGA